MKKNKVVLFLGLALIAVAMLTIASACSSAPATQPEVIQPTDVSENNAWLDVINLFAQKVLEIILPIIAAAIAANLVKAWQYLQSKLSEKQMTILLWAVDSAVWATEQAYKSGIIPKEIRRDYAIDYVQKLADQNGIKVKVEDLVVLVEAAVGKELNQNKLLTASSQA